MDPVGSAALASWRLDVRLTAVLLAAALIYLRGWLRGRRLVRSEEDTARLACFFGGLAAVYLAIASPLDSFDNLFLSAHMTQHLLLLMIAPPLVLLGHPVLPLLRGLPKRFVKEALGPFLAWPLLRRVASAFVAPPVAWLLFAVSTIFWHLPRFYELALRWPVWHGVEHASFFWTGILFWWPVVRPAPGKNRWPEWVAIPYLLFGDILNTAISAFFIFSGRLLYPSYAAVQASGINPRNDQTLAGAIMWVPGSIIYLLPAIVLTMRLVSGRSPQPTLTRVQRSLPTRPPYWNAKRLPVLRRYAQVAMLALAIAVMADGFFGTQVAPLNLAGVLPWIHWRALSLIALLAVGNLFCMACPFTLVRDIGRRVLPAKWRWPRALRTKWLAFALLILYLWAYEAFGLWNSPWLTAWIIAGYFTAALLVDGLFRGASFCKYVCPIGQYHFVSSLVSPRHVGVKSAAVCKSCRTHDCIKGNEHARGCELYLFQPKKGGNLDCTFCMDCVKACPHDNVALLSIAPASAVWDDPYRSSIGRLSKRTDLAAVALVVVFGAFVNAAGMVDPVAGWEHAWRGSVAAFVLGGVIVLPLLTVLLCAVLNRLAGARQKTADTVRRFIFSLVPLGVSMWAAHLLYHLAMGWNPSDWLTPTQILLLDAGVLLTLYVAWRIAKQYSERFGQTIALLAPWSLLSLALYAAGIWILFQPMQMRGMMMH